MKKLAAFALALTLALSAFTVNVFAESANDPPAFSPGSYKFYIEGFEWGPSVTRLVLELGGTVEPVDAQAAQFAVSAAVPGFEGVENIAREVTGAYTSNANGEPVNSASKYVTITLKYGGEPGFVGGGAIAGSSPFSYDMATGYNNWLTGNYTITVSDLKIGGEETTLTMPETAYAGKIQPETDGLKKGSYTLDGVKLTYAAFETSAMKNDGAKNPLIIWLHGAGEGGTDVDLALLGNDVTEIMKDGIQKYFTNGGVKGAYVFVPQAPTVWMDAGKGQHGGDEPFIYTAALKYAIDSYIKENGDIDPNRVYIGGCSNGGYMTVNMLVEYPGFFAAAYPVCEAYMDSYLTDAKLNIIKDMPIWFTQSRDDTTVAPVTSTIPTFVRLLQAGAENVHFSFSDTVVGLDEPGLQYMGHFSWVYSHSDRSVKDQDHAWVLSNAANILAKAAELAKEPAPDFGAPDTRAIAASDFPASGVNVTLNGKVVGMWEWLAAQTAGSTSVLKDNPKTGDPTDTGRTPMAGAIALFVISGASICIVGFGAKRNRVK